MKSFKIVLRILIIVICLYLSWLALTLFNYRPYKLTGDYYFIGKGKEYSINKGLLSSPLITGKTSGAEWMISDRYIYGYNKAITNEGYDIIEYYIIDQDKNAIQLFDNSWEFNKHLTEKGLPKYNMSDSENIAHIKFNNRKFKV
ncbi:MAG: hypothetical protein ACLGH8_17635 [Bacteroidia bacterium]